VQRFEYIIITIKEEFLPILKMDATKDEKTKGEETFEEIKRMR